jgi:hypothetical protein
MELGAGKRKLYMPKPQLFDFTTEDRNLSLEQVSAKKFRWTRNLPVGYQSNEKTEL